MAAVVDVTVSGPMFDGRAAAAYDAFEIAAAAAVGDMAYMEVRAELARNLRNPTGFYESRVIHDRASASGDGRVHDSDVIYGPWLEGTGSRNSPVTRFAGYRSFRSACQRADTRAVDVAQRVLDGYLARMR